MTGLLLPTWNITVLCPCSTVSRIVGCFLAFGHLMMVLTPQNGLQRDFRRGILVAVLMRGVLHSSRGAWCCSTGCPVGRFWCQVTTRKTTRKKATKSTARGKKSTTAKRRTTARKTTARKTTPLKAPVAPWEEARNLFPGVQVRVIDVPWELGSYVRSQGAKKLDQVGWVIPAEKCVGVVAAYAAKPYSWGRFVEDRANQVVFTPSPTTDTGEFQLRDDQVEDAATAVTAWDAGCPEVLVTNGTGTGKTVTAIAAVNQTDTDTVVVFCPKSVIPSWRRTLSMMGDGGKRWIIINYESSKKLIRPPAAALRAKSAKTRNKHIALSGVPWFVAGPKTMVVCDESHKVKNPTSQQSRVVDKFFDGGAKGLRLTATPGGPADLHYLKRGLSWATGGRPFTVSEGDFSDYINWCRRHGVDGVVKAKFGNGITFEGGRKDAEAMNGILFGPSKSGVRWGIHRVMETWPDQERIGLPMELTPDQWELYNMEWSQFQKSMRDVNRVMGNTSSSKASVNKARMTGLAAQIRYRQKIGGIKAGFAAELAKEYVSEGNQVVLSCIYHDTVDTLAAELDRLKVPYVVTNGQVTGDDREEARVKFQTGEVSVIINSVTTGVSMHAGETAVGGNSVPRRTIVVEAHYSATECAQNEGRSQRNGESAPVTYLFAEGTIDEKVVSTVLKRMLLQSDVLGDTDDGALLADLGKVFGFDLVG